MCAVMNVDRLKERYNVDKNELVSNLLKVSLQYVINVHGFNEDEYFVEDVTAIIAEYELLILKMVNELIQASIEVVMEFSEKYPKP